MQPSPIEVTESPWVPSARRASFSIDCSSRSCERLKYGPVLARRPPQRHVQTAGGRTILPHNLGPAQLQEEHLVFCVNHFLQCPLASGTWPLRQFFPSLKVKGARHVFFRCLALDCAGRNRQK